MTRDSVAAGRTERPGDVRSPSLRAFGACPASVIFGLASHEVRLRGSCTPVDRPSLLLSLVQVPLLTSVNRINTPQGLRRSGPSAVDEVVSGWELSLGPSLPDLTATVACEDERS
jgi:hypothetical protein